MPEFATYAQAAGLSPAQALVVELWIEGASIGKICVALSLQRTEGFRLRDEAIDKLALHVPEFWHEAQEFPRSLVRAVANRADHRSDRDGNLTGVAPAYDVATHLPAARVITADRRELRQGRSAALRLWGQANRPVLVPSL